MSSPFPPPPQTPAPARTVPAGAGAPAPRSLPAGAGTSWWSEAWRIFTAAPGTWIAIGIAFVLIEACLNVVPVVGGLVGQILAPVFAGGVMLGCHALARGEPLRFSHLFAGFNPPHFAPLAILGLVMFAISLAIAAVFVLVLIATVGMGGLTAVFSGDPAQIGMATFATLGAAGLVASLLGLVVGTVVVMLYWFAPALIALQGMAPFEAMKSSWQGCVANLGAFLLYGLVGIGLAIVATIPFGLGWLALGPVAAGSLYAGWRQVYSS